VAAAGNRGIRLLAATAVAIAALAFALASCGGASSPSAAPTLTIGDPWVLVSGGVDQPAAGYLTITNTGATDDALRSVSCPGAAMIGLHKSSMDASGMMGMTPVDRIDIPAGGSVSLAPGGYHLMISGLKAPLKPGDRLELDLVFDHAGPMVVEAEVRQG
jgi:copper(I)-binding protein